MTNERMSVLEAYKMIIETSLISGMDRAKIYAISKTGKLNPKTPEHKKEWFNAVNEYNDLKKGGR